MFGQTKDMGSVGPLVGPNPLENRHSVVEGVGQDMNIGLLPRNHLVIHENPAAFLQHESSFVRKRGEKGRDYSSPLKISRSLSRLTNRLKTSR